MGSTLLTAILTLTQNPKPMSQQLMIENLRSFARMAKEPSSWAGIGIAALLVGQSTDKITAITNLIAALSALVAAFMPENANKSKIQNNDK